jgi:hypothetical protein
MITRSADLVKEASSQLKRNELMQEYAYFHTKELENRKKQIVMATTRTEQAEKIKDRQSGNRQKQSSERKPAKEPQNGREEELITSVAGGKNKIDIKI